MAVDAGHVAKSQAEHLSLKEIEEQKKQHKAALARKVIRDYQADSLYKSAKLVTVLGSQWIPSSSFDMYVNVRTSGRHLRGGGVHLYPAGDGRGGGRQDRLVHPGRKPEYLHFSAAAATEE